MKIGCYALLATLLVLAGCKAGSGATEAPRPPRSKLALIEAVDRALRRGSVDDLMALVVNPSEVAALCPDASEDERAELRERWERTRTVARERAEFCVALVAWSTARRQVLNYGTYAEPAEQGCLASFLRLEKSELFYAVGDQSVQVDLGAPYAADGRYGLLAPPHCAVKKRARPAELERLRENCPGAAWSRVTQSGGQCP